MAVKLAANIRKIFLIHILHIFNEIETIIEVEDEPCFINVNPGFKLKGRAVLLEISVT